jgi:hypothetical protein
LDLKHPKVTVGRSNIRRAYGYVMFSSSFAAFAEVTF